MLQGKICMHFLWNKGLSRISEIIVMIRITTTENRQNIFYKMSVLHPSKRQQLEMTFYLFNASTLTLLWRTDCNEVSNTSVGHHFLTLIEIFIIFIAVVFKHPNMDICANARYTQNDKKIPTAKTSYAFSEEKSLRWLKIQWKVHEIVLRVLFCRKSSC